MDNVDKILDWIKEQPEYTIYPVTSVVSLFYHVAPIVYAKLIERYVSAQPVSDAKGVEEKMREDNFFPPDNGDICWEIGEKTFTRKEVYYLLYTQRSMVSNDLRRECGDYLTPEMFEILDNPRIPKY